MQEYLETIEQRGDSIMGFVAPVFFAFDLCCLEDFLLQYFSFLFLVNFQMAQSCSAGFNLFLDCMLSSS